MGLFPRVFVQEPLSSQAVDNCFPLLLRTGGGVTECPQGGSHCHQMGGIPMSSHPQHSWYPGLVNPVLPQRTECLAGGSQTTCVLSPSRPHRVHLSCSLLGSLFSDFRTLSKKKYHPYSFYTKQSKTPNQHQRPEGFEHTIWENVYLILDKNILPYLWREETIK